MLLDQQLQVILRRLGARRVEIKANGVASHWDTFNQAARAKEEFSRISWNVYGRAPARLEVFHDNGLFACFVKWPDCLPLVKKN
jgi:hypothetical protein